MGTEFIGYDEFIARVEALEKKFPLKDARKQDIADARELAGACADIDEDDYEDLVDVMGAAVRLKKRYAANLKLVEAANQLGVLECSGPDAIEAIRAMYKITETKRSKKSDEAKAKEVAGLLKKQITAATKSAARWSKRSKECANQGDATIKVSVQIEKAQKALGAKLKGASSDAAHKRMGEIILGHLDAISRDAGKVYGDYWNLEVTLGDKSKKAVKWATDGAVALAKLKGRSALPFLAKLAA